MEDVAAGIASVVHIYDPECVVLGGGVMEQQHVVDGVCQIAVDRLLPPFKSIQIVAASYGNKTNLMGAAARAMGIV